MTADKRADEADRIDLRITTRHVERPPWRLPSVWYGRIRNELQTFYQEWPMREVSAVDHAALEDLLRKAEQEARCFQRNPAWGYLNAATWLALGRMDRQDLEPIAIALAKEGERKLDGWRRAAAIQLLEDVVGKELLDAAWDIHAVDPQHGGEVKAQETDRVAKRDTARAAPHHLNNVPLDQLRSRCQTVKRLLDGHASNIYVKQQVVTRRALLLLGVLAVMVLAVLQCLFPVITHGDLPRHALQRAGVSAFSISVFGAIGATFSALISLPGATANKVPDVMLSAWFTLARPIIGVAAAIVVWQAEQGNLINVVNDSSYSALLTLAFVAGFSDTLVVTMVGRMNPGRKP